MKKSLAIFALIIAFAVYVAARWPQHNGELTITMLDVGQGDAIHIRTPSGVDILVDGGPDRRVLSELGKSMPPYDHTLEYVIATHPDADHIAGLADIPEAYSIGTLMTNGAHKDTGFANAIYTIARHTQMIHPTRGQSLQLDTNIRIEFLHPDGAAQHGDDYNNDSLVFMLHFGSKRFLFAGDIEASVEEDLTHTYGSHLQADLLKVAHHGSSSSTTQPFLDAVQPSIALISAGQDNRFGHPHAGPLFRLSEAGIAIFRTDEQGTIRCVSDSRTIDCKPWTR